MNVYSLKVIACDRTFFEGKCIQVIFKTGDGEVAIMAHHESMAFSVEVGEIRIQLPDETWINGVTGTGFAQVRKNKGIILVDTAEKPEEIDIRRATEAKERALEQLRQKRSIQEYHRSQASLARALSRLRIGNRNDPMGS